MSTNLQIAIHAALEAGKEIMRIYDQEDFEVDFKSDNSPLTLADRVSHEIIDKHLEKTGIPVLSEEGKDIPHEDRKEWDYLWIVDPIDGTKEFIKRNGEFTVNIALIHEQLPLLGVVYAPAIKKLYIADENGSFLIDEVSIENMKEKLKDQKRLPIDYHLDKYTVVASKSHLSDETVAFIQQLEAKYGEVESISIGSSLKLCMVAEGRANCYPRFAPTMEWDTAAGQAICRFAGKDVIDQNTKSTMLYNRAQLLNAWFLVE